MVGGIGQIILDLPATASRRAISGSGRWLKTGKRTSMSFATAATPLTRLAVCSASNFCA